MSVLLRLLALFGWRGALAAAIGAVLASAPAYQAGKWVEGAAAQDRIARALAERDIERLEAENEQVDKARHARDRALGARPDGGGLPDDGFRRD